MRHCWHLAISTGIVSIGPLSPCRKPGKPLCGPLITDRIALTRSPVFRGRNCRSDPVATGRDIEVAILKSTGEICGTGLTTLQLIICQGSPGLLLVSGMSNEIGAQVRGDPSLILRSGSEALSKVLPCGDGLEADEWPLSPLASGGSAAAATQDDQGTHQPQSVNPRLRHSLLFHT